MAIQFLTAEAPNRYETITRVTTCFLVKRCLSHGQVCPLRFSQLGGLLQAMRVFGTQERVDELLVGLNQAVFGSLTSADAERGGAAAAPPPAPH